MNQTQDIWLRWFAVAFAAWAAMVGWAANEFIGDVRAIASLQRESMLSNERRITVLEQEVQVHISEDARIHREVDELRGRLK